MLPCPACAASVRGRNLVEHLDRKHPDEQGESSWSGKDRRVRRPLTVVLALLLLGVGAVAVLDTERAPIVGFASLAVVLLFVVVSAALGTAAVLATGAPPARVRIGTDGVVLRYGLGLGRHRVSFPARVEVGGLQRVSGGSGTTSTSDPRVVLHAGTYLALVSGRRRLTIGCTTSTGVREHWTGWRQGDKRRTWDVTLDAGDFVAVQYALHAAEHLAPRTLAPPRSPTGR